jgi:hypothetical protein
MLRIAVVLTGLALPSVALADTCEEIHASIQADFDAASDDAARLIQRRFDLFSLASNQTDGQLEAVARQAGEQAADMILQAEISRRNERAAIDMLCPIRLP